MALQSFRFQYTPQFVATAAAAAHDLAQLFDAGQCLVVGAANRPRCLAREPARWRVVRAGGQQGGGYSERDSETAVTVWCTRR